MAIKIEKFACLLALCLLLLACPNIDASFVSPLKFVLMVASGSSSNSSAVVSAVDQTLKEINADDFLLPEHRLEYILRDTKVQLARNEHLSEETLKVMINKQTVIFTFCIKDTAFACFSQTRLL